MKNIKKRYVLSLAIILMISLSACKGNDIVGTVQADSDTNVEQGAGEKEQATIAQQYALSKTIQQDGDREVVTNQDSVAVVVNKQRALPDGYEPSDLVEPNVKFSFNEKVEKRLMRKEAAEALESLFAGAKDDGYDLFAVSGYRSYKRQVTVFNSSVQRNGREHAEKFSAEPGKSEHQTGLAMDVSSQSANFGLEQSFSQTDEGQWLAEHAADYGFVIRYPEGKEEITGYLYEPWHVRYVGIETAKDIASQGVTLEEYFDDTGTIKA
jgi:D-alanyl-D-alanine carboxypeptidase